MFIIAIFNICMPIRREKPNVCNNVCRVWIPSCSKIRFALSRVSFFLRGIKSIVACSKTMFLSIGIDDHATTNGSHRSRSAKHETIFIQSGDRFIQFQLGKAGFAGLTLIAIKKIIRPIISAVAKWRRMELLCKRLKPRSGNILNSTSILLVVSTAPIVTRVSPRFKSSYAYIS